MRLILSQHYINSRATYPEEFNGHKTTSDLMDGGYGKWKYYENGPWELCNMDEDRSEARNSSEQYPNLVKKLSGMWNNWAYTHNVCLTP